MQHCQGIGTHGPQSEATPEDLPQNAKRHLGDSLFILCPPHLGLPTSEREVEGLG